MLKVYNVLLLTPTLQFNPTYTYNSSLGQSLPSYANDRCVTYYETIPTNWPEYLDVLFPS